MTYLTFPTPPNRLTDTDTQFVTKADAVMDYLANTMDGELTAVVAAAADYLKTTSTDSVAIGTGSKSWTDVDAGKSFTVGQWVLAMSDAAPTTDWMLGTVTSYSSTTLTVNVSETSGSGSKSDWTIVISGPRGTAGDTLASFSGNALKFLRTNSGETASEWQALGFEQIGTSSPSAATEVDFTSIPQTYQDLLLVFDLTNAVSVNILIQVSDDGGSTFSGTSFAIASASTSNRSGAALFVGYTNSQCLALGAAANDATSPVITTASSETAKIVRADGGLDGLRIKPGSSTFSGTVTLYGRI